jgi:hypothetical protein
LPECVYLDGKLSICIDESSTVEVPDRYDIPPPLKSVIQTNKLKQKKEPTRLVKQEER